MDLQKEISALSPERRNLLALLVEKAAAPSVSARRISRRNADKAEVSFAQQRLWFLQKLNPSNAAHNTPAALHIFGDLNIEVLEKVFTFLVSRHEALRLFFREEKGRIFQLVKEPFAAGIAFEDFSETPARERDSIIENRVSKDIAAPFALDECPLFRVHLYRLAADEFVLLLNMHHIISDGWSLGVIIDEFAALYESFLLGKKVPLAELEIQYPDFAAWERTMVESGAWSAQLEYWKKNLAGRAGGVKLPFAANRNRKNLNPVETASMILRADIVGKIRKICHAERCSLYTLLLAAFNVLLYRYSGQKKFLIGSPVANRNRAETEKLIGCFINPLAIGATLDGEMTFAELLAQTAKTALDAFDNQNIPFERVLDAIRRERRDSQKRLFNVWFVLQNAPLSEMNLPGLKIANYKLPRIAPQFDIAMNISETGDEIHCAVEYSTAALDAVDARRLLENFKNILTAAAGSLDVKLEEISLDDVQPDVQARAASQYSEDDFDF